MAGTAAPQKVIINRKAASGIMGDPISESANGYRPAGVKAQHPGEKLFRHFMQPEGISINRLAREIHVPPNRISHIVNGKRAISADTALRLARFFNTTPKFWLNLQNQFDLDVAEAEAGAAIARHVKPLMARNPAA